ncbi:hypothetical protein GE09DRAFT_590525 [Coniochaeta sp. 2T2.1]|nr:hypothetical protein GE09DRAFT_590525 [Coniochaeta sp. 2T2.1]
MPKRQLDVSGLGAASSERATKKTERSHEENQERAYIAASRRADRSVEARVQSARMASEIHKKRTGKGFKISEEIVMKEEMYEEEEDDLPRHYRALAAHLHTSSPDMNSRLSAYLTGQVAMASMARQKEVDKLFAESFPNAARMGLQMQQSAYFQGLQAAGGPSSPQQQQQQPHSPQFSTGDPVRRPSSLSVAHSHFSGNSNSYMHSPLPQQQQQQQQQQHERRPSADSSPPVLSPETGHTDASSSSHSTPHFTPAQQYHPYIAPQSLSHNHHHQQQQQQQQQMTHHHQQQQPQFQSSFTSELPQDAKLLANINLSDPLAGAFYGMPHMGALASNSHSDTFDYAQFNSSGSGIPDDSSISKQLAAYPQGGQQQTDYFHAAMQPQGRYVDFHHGQESRIGTPGGGEGDSWDNWIDENQWSGMAGAGAGEQQH